MCARDLIDMNTSGFWKYGVAVLMFKDLSDTRSAGRGGILSGASGKTNKLLDTGLSSEGQFF